VILTPGVWVEGPSFKAPDLSRLKAIMRILFGIVEDAPGLAISGKRPHWVGPGPGDPGPGPLREALARLGSSEQRDTLLGLSLAEIGTLLGNSALAREVGALAARVVARASGRSAAPASAQRDRGANRLGGRNALLQRVFAASRRNTRT
jgi:hypothetical protein